MARAHIILRIESNDEALAKEMERVFRGLKVLIAQQCPGHGTSVILAVPDDGRETIDVKCLHDSVKEILDGIEDMLKKGQGMKVAAAYRARDFQDAKHDTVPEPGAYPSLPGSGEPF